MLPRRQSFLLPSRFSAYRPAADCSSPLLTSVVKATYASLESVLHPEPSHHLRRIVSAQAAIPHQPAQGTGWENPDAGEGKVQNVREPMNACLCILYERDDVLTLASWLPFSGRVGRLLCSPSCSPTCWQPTNTEPSSCLPPTPRGVFWSGSPSPSAAAADADGDHSVMMVRLQSI